VLNLVGITETVQEMKQTVAQCWSSFVSNINRRTWLGIKLVD